ncbi:HAMP domain-containing sensor histidine kinase [Frankia sp. AgB32]|uniref:sensor histidine kinase n=1 Tax=Frankia sp. AgB32 TaxID=631119 RepID=UPI00200C93C6|nr:HAMP domain-containing sensor histidine kinase [Frankia sp. AgB32]MCK9895981.1 HAMP domain-containing histidine kinase [Frankia sp. AgB32]
MPPRVRLPAPVRLTRRFRLTLRVRLTLLFAVGTGIALVLAGFLFYLLLRANLRDAVDSELRTRSDVLAARIADRYADGAEPNPASARDAATLLAGGGPIAQVLTADGQVIASSADAGRTALATGAALSTAHARAVWAKAHPHRDGETDEPIRVYALPVHVSGPTGRTTLIAVVGLTTRPTDSAEDRVRNVMVVATAPLVALSGLAAWLLAGAALRPVDRMRREAAAMADAEDHALAGPRPGPGGPDPRPAPAPGPAPGPGPGPAAALALAVPATRDEIEALARTMNDLLARLHAARARDRAFIADAGHELRTPLTVLKAELELAARPGRSVAELREAIAGASEETERLIRLAESLLTLARMDGGHLRADPVAVDEVLDRAVRAAGGHAGQRGVRLAVAITPADRPLAVLGDADLLRQGVDNLLTNAVRHAPAGSVVDLLARRDAPGDTVTVQVRDHGGGFPVAFLPHAFERFRRADAARGREQGGTGLGLSIVAAIAAAHGGTARVSNHRDGGAVVTIVLPAAAPPPPAPDPPAGGAPPTAAHPGTAASGPSTAAAAGGSPDQRWSRRSG